MESKELKKRSVKIFTIMQEIRFGAHEDKKNLEWWNKFLQYLSFFRVSDANIGFNCLFRFVGHDYIQDKTNIRTCIK